MKDPAPKLSRLAFYAAVTAVVVLSFLAQIVRGECPVP